ncbi:MAG: hypothetical protein FRX49_00511 [Trebouxia sp. A1-2]|nr:MAG: hypothetical protein FRX49_00511 [Trebouxia sp. A1-2]
MVEASDAQPRAACDGTAVEDLPAVFWDEMPTNKDNVDLAAINALIEEQTPVERAESHKNQGNEALKTGLKHRKKFYFREAITAYTKGLDVQCGDSIIETVLLSNRAQVHLQLGNDRNALEDSLRAMKLDTNNVKACYRAARASYNLKQYSKALTLAEQGIAIDAGASELKRIQQDAQQHLQAEEQRAVERAAREKAKRGPAQQLASTLISLRSWQIGKPQLSIGDRKPFVAEDSLVHWPVMFVYPETMQTDAVEDFVEVDSLQQHLDVMFSPDAPPLDWDDEHQYTRDKLELYYLSHAARPLPLEQLTEVLYGGWPQDLQDAAPQRYGPKASKWCQVSENLLLGEVLAKPDYVIPGIPVFFVVSKGSNYRERFLSDEIPLF